MFPIPGAGSPLIRAVGQQDSRLIIGSLFSAAASQQHS